MPDKVFKAKLTREQPRVQQSQFRGIVSNATLTNEMLLTASSKTNLAAQIAIAEVDGWKLTSK